MTCQAKIYVPVAKNGHPEVRKQKVIFLGKFPSAWERVDVNGRINTACLENILLK